MKKIFLTGFLSFFSMAVFAQEKATKNSTSMKIVVDDNGKQQIIEKTFSDDEMAQKEIKKFSDSLDVSMTKSNGKRKIITVNVNKNRNEFSSGDSTKKSRRIIIRKDGADLLPQLESENDVMILRNDGKRIKMMDRMGRPDMPPLENEIHVEVGPEDVMPDRNMRFRAGKMKLSKEFKEQRQSKTIQGLFANPNNPFNGKLNVRFNALQKADVVISVTDVNGKEIVSESVKNFEGKYLGQVDLKKANSGIYFVRVVQNGDGMVIRVEI